MLGVGKFTVLRYCGFTVSRPDGCRGTWRRGFWVWMFFVRASELMD